MTIIGRLKLLFSVLLICCLFLPLSQCTKIEKQNNGAEPKKVIENQYAFKSPKEIESWVSALTLIAPFALFFIAQKSLSKIKIAIVFLLFSGAAFYVTFSVTFGSDRILIGGYLAYTSSISLIVLTLIELGLSIRLYLKMRNA